MSRSSLGGFGPVTFEQWRGLDAPERERRLAGEDADPAWIIPPGKLAAPARAPGPLDGLAVAIKDNIDLAGVPTTAGCPAFAYTPADDATVVTLLRQAGASIVGKTNLDQFATGLVGTRSPFGVVPNVHDARYVGGGSSSGSASVVARGLVPLALGTDTAGSGRVPAGLQGIVGLKPTRGWFSTRGVFPACRSLDCVSIFTANVSDAAVAASVLGRFDPDDEWARPQPSTAQRLPRRKIGIPSTLPWFGDAVQERAWNDTLGRWRSLGFELVPLDPTPLWELASLLYGGPWVAERLTHLSEFFTQNRDQFDPSVRAVLDGARAFDATSVFRAEEKRRRLARDIDHQWAEVDALLVPTVPRVYTLDQIAQDPLETNSVLGTWTNFVNLADLCALSVPAGRRSDGLPFGVTLLGPAWSDVRLVQLGQEWERSQTEVMVCVVGAHLSGLPLNRLLTTRGARLVGPAKTAPLYRLYALEDQSPPKPGLVRVADQGASVAVEVWAVPVANYGAFVAEIPPPLGIGTVELDDGRRVQGFLCEPWTLTGRRDITEWGGWKAWLASRSS